MIESREDLEDLMADLAIYRKYKTARGILGKRFRNLRAYLLATGEITK